MTIRKKLIFFEKMLKKNGFVDTPSVVEMVMERTMTKNGDKTHFPQTCGHSSPTLAHGMLIDRQQATGNRQQATGNRQQATGNYTLAHLGCVYPR
ncbi:MAG: hypothetical protein FWC64_03250 [Treponema sp.]|nr:hypothetical protein [Treponema sp.]